MGRKTLTTLVKSRINQLPKPGDVIRVPRSFNANPLLGLGHHMNYAPDITQSMYICEPADIEPLNPYQKKPVSRVNVLVDADLLVYRAGFSAARKEMEMTALGIVQARLDAMVQAAWKNIHDDLGINSARVDSHLVMFLTGCKKIPNFREDVAPFYKAQRKDSSKPPYYEELRQHIEDNYSTVVSEGVEADDYFGQAMLDAAAKDPNSLSVVVSLDKDLLMIPGLHYNFVKETWTNVTPAGGIHFFFTQMLMGDTADNIPGLKGYGPKKAAKILDNCSTSGEKFKKVAHEYIKVHGEQHWQHHWDVHCDLLWILRRLDEGCPWKTNGDSYKRCIDYIPDEALWQEKQEKDQANQ